MAPPRAGGSRPQAQPGVPEPTERPGRRKAWASKVGSLPAGPAGSVLTAQRGRVPGAGQRASKLMLLQLGGRASSQTRRAAAGKLPHRPQSHVGSWGRTDLTSPSESYEQDGSSSPGGVGVIAGEALRGSAPCTLTWVGSWGPGPSSSPSPRSPHRAGPEQAPDCYRRQDGDVEGGKGEVDGGWGGGRGTASTLSSHRARLRPLLRGTSKEQAVPSEVWREGPATACWLWR